MKLHKVLAALGWALCAMLAQAADPAGLLGTQLPAAESLQADTAPLRLAPDQLENLLALPSTTGMRSLLKARDIDLARRGSKEVGIHRRIAPSTVFLQQGEQTCSGSIIGANGEILTCWHCVRGTGLVDVRLHPQAGKKPTRARVIRVDEEKDLALLKIVEPMAGLPILPLGNAKEIEVGADVYAIGHPLGLHWSFVKGLISQTYAKRIWQSGANRHESGVVQSQIDLYTGNSGGPLVSENGQLIGINASKVEGEKFAFAIALPDIKRFLDRGGEVRSETAGVSGPAKKFGCAHKQLARGRNADNTGTVALYDTNCDGKVDVQVLALDGAADDFVIASSSDGSGRVDMVRAHKGASIETYLAGTTRNR
jgi:S1-C subfamily serine protease